MTMSNNTETDVCTAPLELCIYQSKLPPKPSMMKLQIVQYRNINIYKNNRNVNTMIAKQQLNTCKTGASREKYCTCTSCATGINTCCNIARKSPSVSPT